MPQLEQAYLLMMAPKRGPLVVEGPYEVVEQLDTVNAILEFVRIDAV